MPDTACGSDRGAVFTASPTPRRVRSPLGALALVAALSLGAACSSSKPAATPVRPTTKAVLEIVSPTPSAVVSPHPKLVFKLIGAKVLPASAGSAALRGDQGHIHVSVDGRIVSMAYGTSQTLATALTPGQHTVAAEFVAADHRAFANRGLVTKAVVITVAT